MSRNHGYIYYEADCFYIGVNPFIDPNVNEPTLASGSQPPLKGISEETIKARNTFTEFSTKIRATGKFDGLEEGVQPILQEMSKDISKQRKRLGGNWAIAQAVFSRSQRDFLKKAIGPDLVFIVLNLTNDCQEKRLQERHGDGIGM